MTAELPGGDEFSDPSEETDPAFQDFLTDITPDEIYRDAALQYLNIQIADDSNFNARNLQIFATGTAILPLTFALLSTAEKSPSTSAKWFLIAAVVAYMVSIVFSLTASFYNVVQYKPDLLTLEGHLEKYSGQTLLFWIGREYRLSTLDNDRLLEKKSRLIAVAWIGLCFEGALISFAALRTLL